MSAPAGRFTVKRTVEGGAIVFLNGHRMTHGDDWTASKFNDEALYWSEAVPYSRTTDVSLLAAQYLYSGEVGQIDDVRPLCTYGDVGSGFCPAETVPGSLYCAEHTKPDNRKRRTR